MISCLMNCVFSARIILVHLVTPDDDEMCRRLVPALQNFLSLICSMSGPCRLPFIGLVAIVGPQSEASF